MNDFKNKNVYCNVRSEAHVRVFVNGCAVSFTPLIWKLPKYEESNTELAVTINYSVWAKITVNIFSKWNA